MIILIINILFCFYYPTVLNSTHKFYFSPWFSFAQGKAEREEVSSCVVLSCQLGLNHDTHQLSRNSSFQSLCFGHPLVWIFPGTLLVGCPGQLIRTVLLWFISLFQTWGMSFNEENSLSPDLRQRLLLITSAVTISQCSFTHQSSQFISSKMIQPNMLNPWMSLLHYFIVHRIFPRQPGNLSFWWSSEWFYELLSYLNITYHIRAII